MQEMVRRKVKFLFEHNEAFSDHFRSEHVPPGDNPIRYGSAWSSSLGVFMRVPDFVEGGGIDTLLSGAWRRIAHPRIDPEPNSYRAGPDRMAWQLHFIITDKDGHRRALMIPAEDISTKGALPAIRRLRNAGVRSSMKNEDHRALVRFLSFRKRVVRVRIPRPGWHRVDSYDVYVRSNKTLGPPSMGNAVNNYLLDDAQNPDHYGHQIAGTTKEWKAHVAEPLHGNSLAALVFGMAFAADLLPFADEQPGGANLVGPSGIGKSALSAAAQSIKGTPYANGRPHAYGRSWEDTSTGSEYLAVFRNHSLMAKEEIHRGDPDSIKREIYKLLGGGEKTRAIGGSSRRLQQQVGFEVLLLSTGEKTVAQHLGKLDDAEGVHRRLIDVSAEVQPGSAFETISGNEISAGSLGKIYAATNDFHGAVGQDWQQHLTNLQGAEIKARIRAERQSIMSREAVRAIMVGADPQVGSVIRQFVFWTIGLTMAIDVGLLSPSWSREESIGLMIKRMQRWAEWRGNLGTAGEVLRTERHIREELSRTLADRFIDLRKHKGSWVPATDADAIKQRTPEAFDGYMKLDLDRILIRPKAWARLCAGCDPSKVAEHFRRNGVLTPDNSGKLSRSEQVPTKIGRFYVISSAFLGA